ncbi:MAG TPA: FHA domain-containing protein [Acidimicrobiales bacterium]|nr:FHA domain-containing protein [Acidimicrobiales bacterium]
MPELEVATAEASYVFADGDVVTIGRRDDNKVILMDPTVSRQHAVIRFESGAWVLEDLSSGRTFYEGQPVAKLTLDSSPRRVNFASPTGPWITASAGQSERTASVAESAKTSAGDTADVPVVGGLAATTAGPAAAFAAVPAAQWTPAYRPTPPGPPATPFGPAAAPAAPRRGSLDADSMKRAFHILFPFRSWIENAGWRSGVRLVILVYAMLPVVFLVVFANTTNFQTLGYVYGLYTAPLWMLAFWWLIKPEDTPRTLLITGAAVAVVVLLYMAGPLKWYYSAVNPPSTSPGNWFRWLVSAGLNEEFAKDGSALLCILAAGAYFKKRLGVRSCMFLGTVAGLTFGVREAAFYQDKDVSVFAVATGAHALVTYVLEFSLRIFTDGLQHAEWAGIACFFFGLGLNYTRRRVPLILFGYLFGAILHATNDWSTGVSSWLWVVLQVLWAALFLGYTLFAPSIEAQVRETSLFRGDSIIAERLAVDQGPNPLGPDAAGRTG